MNHNDREGLLLCKEVEKRSKTLSESFTEEAFEKVAGVLLTKGRTILKHDSIGTGMPPKISRPVPF